MSLYIKTSTKINKTKTLPSALDLVYRALHETIDLY